MGLFKGSKIIITGGSRGIGAAAVRHFTQLGADVAFIYKSSDSAAKLLSSETGAHAYKCDISDPAQVHDTLCEIMKSFGGTVDLLVCNAAISRWGLATDMSVEEWNEVIDTNLNGAYYAIREILPTMISAHSGNIITISSMWGQVGASCEVAYSAAKAGLIGMTKALAKEVGPSGVRVNCIAPGLIDTDMNASLSSVDKAAIIDETPLARIGVAADIVNTIEYLAGEQSSFVTGQVIAVNGGFV